VIDALVRGLNLDAAARTHLENLYSTPRRPE